MAEKMAVKKGQSVCRKFLFVLLTVSLTDYGLHAWRC